MPYKGWQRTFDDPIPLPGGSKLRTLRDAASYITGLPKREHDAPAWRAAIEALMLVAERGGPTTLARIGVMRPLYRDEKSAPRKKPAKHIVEPEAVLAARQRRRHEAAEVSAVMGVPLSLV